MSTRRSTPSASIRSQGNRYTYCNTPRDCRPCEQGLQSNSGFPRAMCNGVTTTQNNCSTPPNHTTAEAANDMFTIAQRVTSITTKISIRGV